MLEECQEALCFFRTIGFWIFWCRSEEGSPSLVVLKILRMALFGCLWSYLGERNMISRINWVQLEFYGMIPSMWVGITTLLGSYGKEGMILDSRQK